MSLDLLVIGAGLSGLCAALTAAQAGLSVRVVAKGMGSHHWHTGAIDVLGYLPGQNSPVDHPFRAIAELPSIHPYRQLGADNVRANLESIVHSLDAGGFAFSEDTGKSTGDNAAQEANQLFSSPVGAPRPTWRVPVGQSGGNLARNEPMLIVGFEGLRDFYPALIADHLQQQGIQARAAWVPHQPITQRTDSNSVHFAEALDTQAAVETLGRAIQPLLRPGERVGLPAILGLQRHRECLAQLRALLDAPVFEIPTLPPSVPGIRLYRALVKLLEKHHVRVEAGMEAISYHVQDHNIQWVETATGSRPLRHRAGRYLLATGGILGEGFRSDHTGRIHETVFDLPLVMPPNRGAWFRAEFLDPQGQPVFSGGIQVNRAFQPVREPGDRELRGGDPESPCYPNLWAAGNGLAHCDSLRERSLEGIAIATGVAAARAIIG